MSAMRRKKREKEKKKSGEEREEGEEREMKEEQRQGGDIRENKAWRRRPTNSSAEKIQLAVTSKEGERKMSQ